MPDQHLRPEDILNLMGIQGIPGVFVLSPFEQPVNVVSQQLRATNLIYAIDKTRSFRSAPGAPPSPQLSIAVVGAGAAGCTAAAYALLLGHCVTLFEREANLFSPLRGGTRHLDPTLFEWPKRTWLEDQASIPVLRWSSSSAHDVVADLENQITSWSALYEELDIHTGVHVYADDIEFDGEKLRLDWRKNRGTTVTTERFDVVVLAVGFGPERQPRSPTFNITPYWRQEFGWVDKSVKRVLVVGNGDGSYADLLRICLDIPEGEAILREWILAAHDADSTLAAQVTSIEDAARQLRTTEASAMLSKAYGELDSTHLDDIVAGRLRDISIVHVGRTPAYLNPRSYPLNRLLVSRIARLLGDRYCYHTDRTDVWKPDGAVRKVQAQFFNETGARSDSFDGFAYRTGPDFTLRTSYPGLFERCQDIEAATRLGLSRRALWSTRSQALAGGKLSVAGGTRLRLYSDFYDPPMQAALLRDVGPSAQQLLLGRLRLHCLLFDRVVLTDAQIVDGALLGELSRDDIKVLSPRLEFRLRRRSVAETFLELAASPFRWSSLNTMTSREVLNSAAHRVGGAAGLIAELTDHSIAELRALAERIAVWTPYIDRSADRHVWQLSGRPTVVDDSDPGQFHSQLPRSAQPLFENVYRRRHESRSSVLAYLESSTATAADEIARIRYWYERAYNRAIARKLECGVVETVWIGEPAWQQTSAGHGVSLPASGTEALSLNWRLGSMSPDGYSELQERVEVHRFAWMLGRQNTLDMLRLIESHLPADQQPAFANPGVKSASPWLNRLSQFAFDEVPWHFDRDEDSHRLALSEWAAAPEPLPLALTFFTRRLLEAN